LRLPPGVQPAGVHYYLCRRGCQIVATMLFQVRVFNRHFEPADGGAVYICNHQSFLDPVLMAMALKRPMNFMARDSLFRLPGFKQLIRSVNTFPVRRAAADTGALKEAMRRLKAGGQVVVFPEGTRTGDGRIRRFLPGVALLAQRAATWTVPVLIDGAFEAWPRTKLLPVGGNIVVQYGQPIPQGQIRKMTTDQFVGMVRQKLIDMQSEVRIRLCRPQIAYCPTGE
jgi:1-acyl-sn-glycerol-3-phosphate acyltransferase